MEYTLQDNTQPAILPAMKKARLLITAGIILQIIFWLVFNLFGFTILENLNWDFQTYGNIVFICTVLIALLKIIGFSQFYFTGYKLFRIAAISMAVWEMIPFFINYMLYLLFGSAYNTTPSASLIYQLFILFGLSALWLASDNYGRMILTTLAAIYLFSLGYDIVSADLQSFSSNSNPLVYVASRSHDAGFSQRHVHIVALLIIIAQLLLWWRFCTSATPDADRNEAGFTKVLISRPFISYIICGIIMMLTLNFLSHQILS